MKRFLLLLFPIIIACNNKNVKQQQSSNVITENCSKVATTYYFIRHAEKDTTDANNSNPELTQEGLKRVENWTQTFKDIDLDFVYSSNYIRTRHTADPIANSKNLPVIIYDTKDPNNADFLGKTANKSVLIVGHSNLNPKWVNMLIEEDKYESLDEGVYGSLFIVNKFSDGSSNHKVLYIN